MSFSIYKRKWKQNGKTVESKKYYGKYRLEGKTIVVKLGCSDKQVALAKLQKVVNEAEREAAGLLPPKPLRESAQTPLMNLYKEHLADLKTTGCTPKHLKMLSTRFTNMVQQCDWKYLKDVTPESFNRWRNAQSFAPKTLNDYLGMATAFFNWLIKTERYSFNPLKNISKVTPRKTRFRRAFTIDELKKLTSQGKYRLVYWLAATTGLRAAEIKSLQWGDLHQQGDEAWLSVRGSTTKNRKDATIPLVQELVQELITLRSIHYKGSDPIFAVVPRNRTFCLDLKKCEIVYQDDQGRYADFHSLRVTCATLLQKTGTAPRVIQELMRHSDPRLTHMTYTDSTQMPIFDAVKKLPTLSSQINQLTPELTQTTVLNSHCTSNTVKTANTDLDLQVIDEKHVSRDLTPKVTTCLNRQKMEAAGFEPASPKLIPTASTSLVAC